MVLFWRDVQRIKGAKNKLSARVDEVMNEKHGASLWKNKFCPVLNKVHDSKHKMEFTFNVRLANKGVVDKVSPEEVCLYAS